MDVLAILGEYGIEGEPKDNEFLTLCPFHADTNPSLSINTENGKFRCFSCDAKGDVFSFLAASVGASRTAVKRQIESGSSTPTACSPTNAIQWNKKLLESPAKLKLLRGKGISKREVEKYLLGFDGRRITIPIYDRGGNLVNIRKYLHGAQKKKFLNTKGCGGADLYPIEVLESDAIIVTEGELKAILLCALGLPAISMTGGAKTWPAEWNPLFAGKKVFIMYDIDAAGKRGAEKVAANLYQHAEYVRICSLPLDFKKYPTGDITDYVVDEKATLEDVKEVLRKAKAWEPVVFKDQLDSEIHKVHLSASTEAKYYHKCIEAKVVVSAKDTAPYMIPFHCKCVCTRDQDVCSFCPMFKNDEFKLDKKHPVLLEMVGVSSERLGKGLKKAAGIPRSCNTCTFKVLGSANVEEIRVMPQLEITTNATEHVVKQAFYVGHGLETNVGYTST